MGVYSTSPFKNKPSFDALRYAQKIWQGCEYFWCVLCWRYLLLRSLIKHLLSHCCVARQRTHCLQEYEKIKTTPDVCDVRCRSATLRERWWFWERVKMQCFCADIRYWKVLPTRGRRKCIYILEYTFNPRWNFLANHTFKVWLKFRVHSVVPVYL